MKKLILSIGFSLFLILPFLSAQLEWGTHFMNNSLSQSNMSNPALFNDFNVSITIPSVYTGFSNSSFSFHEVIKQDENVFRLDMDEVLNRVGSKGLLIQNNMSVETIGMNFQKEKFLVNFHHGLKVFNKTNLSKEMLQMLWGGNEQFIDETIDIGIQQYFLAYHEVGLALGFKIEKQLTIGTRIKYLKGLATIQTPRSVATVYTNPEFYQLSSETDYLVQTGGFPEEKLQDIDPFKLNNYDRSIFGGNKGFAFDVGMTYRFNNKLTLEASANNIGFIKWKENAYDHQSKGNYEYDGLDLQPLVEGGEISTDEIIDSITQIFQFVDTKSTFKTTTPANGYLSMRYELAQRVYVSGFLFMEKSNSLSNYAGGVNLKKDFGTVWALGIQYAYHNKSTHNIGLMTSLRLGPFQFYATTDNIGPIFDPLKTQKFNFRSGLNLVFGNKVKKRQKRQKELLLVQAKQDSLNAILAIADSLSKKKLIVENVEAEKDLFPEKTLLPTEEKKENTSSTTILETEETTAQQKRKAAAEEQKKLEEAKAFLAQKQQEEAQQKRKAAAEEQEKLETAKALLAQKEQQNAQQKRKTAVEEQEKLEETKALLAQKQQEESQQKRIEEAEEQKKLETAKAEVKLPFEEEIEKEVISSEVEMQKQLEAEKAFLAEKEKMKEEQKRREAAILLQQEQDAQAEKERQQQIAEQARIQQAQIQNSQPRSNFGTYSIIKKTSLREEATSSSKVLQRLKLDTKVIVLEKTTKYWWKTDYKGQIGYVKAGTLKK